MTNEAPERIWAWHEEDDCGHHKFWISNPNRRTGEETEYVRADLARPKVKALQWHDRMTGFICTERSSPISYSIMVRRNRVYGLPGEHDGAAEFNTLEAAKAAAQNDYERRILSALEGQDDG